MQIIPAILEKDFINLKDKLAFLLNIRKKYNLDFSKIQIDFCDGDFVKNISWLPQEKKEEEINEILYFTKYFDLEFHLMCIDQYKYFLLAEKLNAKKVIIHIDAFENINILEKIIDLAKISKTKIALTFKIDYFENNKNNIDHIINILHKYKYIDLQIMGIINIGVQGQDFDEYSIEIIKNIRKIFNEKELFIQIDGGINENTVSQIRDLNINAIVVGSYLIGDSKEDIFILRFKKLK